MDSRNAATRSVLSNILLARPKPWSHMLLKREADAQNAGIHSRTSFLEPVSLRELSCPRLHLIATYQRKPKIRQVRWPSITPLNVTDGNRKKRGAINWSPQTVHAFCYVSLWDLAMLWCLVGEFTVHSSRAWRCWFVVSNVNVHVWLGNLVKGIWKHVTAVASRPSTRRMSAKAWKF